MYDFPLFRRHTLSRIAGVAAFAAVVAPLHPPIATAQAPDPAPSPAAKSTVAAVAVHPAAAAPASVATGRSLLVTNLRKPPKTFLDLGDVVGLPEVTMKELGVKDWDFVEIKTGGGATLGVKVKAHGVSPTDIFAAKAIRDIIGLKEGPVELKLNAVKWPSGQDPKPVPQTFTQVVRASKIFLRYGTAVGVSLDMMRAMNATHGQKGTISIPNGRPIDISIFCVDRGSDVIMLKGDLRKALGLPESGSVTLIVTPKAGTVPPPPPPTPSPEGATDAAKDGESD